MEVPRVTDPDGVAVIPDCRTQGRAQVATLQSVGLFAIMIIMTRTMMMVTTTCQYISGVAHLGRENRTNPPAYLRIKVFLSGRVFAFISSIMRLLSLFVATLTVGSVAGSTKSSKSSRKSRDTAVQPSEDDAEDTDDSEEPGEEKDKNFVDKLPPIQYTMDPPNPRFERITKVGTWGGLYSADEGDGTALRITTNGWTVKCVDEFHEFAFFDQQMASQALEAAKYERCERPRELLDASLYEIVPKLSCGLPDNWQRLDCKYTVRDGTKQRVFYASRMDKKRAFYSKPGRFMKDLVGMKGSQKKFHERVRCDEGHRSRTAQLNECKSLLSSWVSIENSFKQLITERDPKVRAAGGAAASEEGKDPAAEEGMSTATIAMIAGGSLLGLGALAVLFKMMSGGGDDKAKPRRKGDKKRHRRQTDEREKSEVSDLDVEENRPRTKHGKKSDKALR